MTFRCRHCPAILHSLAQYREHYRALHFVPPGGVLAGEGGARGAGGMMLDDTTRARVEAIRDHGDMSIAYRQAVGEVLAAYDALLTEQDEILRSRDHMQRLATQAAMSTGEAVARLEAERAQAAPVLAAYRTVLQHVAHGTGYDYPKRCRDAARAVLEQYDA